MSGDEKLAKALKPAFEADVEFIDRVSVLSSTDDFQGLCEWFDGYSPVRFGVARGVALKGKLAVAVAFRVSAELIILVYPILLRCSFITVRFI